MRKHSYAVLNAGLNNVHRAHKACLGLVLADFKHFGFGLINEGLDIGQVSGAFIQGLGWMTSEALYYDAKGKLLSHSPSTYKIPSVHDIPRHFHIELIPNPDNLSNVRGTKAVGEPPLMLCFSVWNAIRDALYAQQRAKGLPQKATDLPVPATAEAVLRALRPESFARFERGL